MNIGVDRNGLHSQQTTARRRQKTINHSDQCGRRRLEEVDVCPSLRHDGLFEFAALAHELKQPLAAILSNAQAAWRFLALDTPDVEEVRAALADIITDARRTDELFRKLQAFVTTGAMERTLLDVNDIVQEVMQLVCRDAARQHITITLNLAAALPPVYGDRVQLRQVILNLVRNAFEAMPQSGNGARTVVVCTSFETPQVITVAVQDSGMGVDELSMTRLFHPFFTTKTGGMGLGLALSRSIISAHGGWSWATRNPQGGLTMSFTLPTS